MRANMELASYRDHPLSINVRTLSDSLPIKSPDEAGALAQAIVDTIRDPLLVLDHNLCVVTANRSFYQMFRMAPQDVRGRPVYGLGDGQWDIPELRLALVDVAPQHAVMHASKSSGIFPISGGAQCS